MQLKNIFYIYFGNGITWFRFFNRWGLHIKNTKNNQLTFSERNGFGNHLFIWKYIIKILRPWHSQKK